MFVSSDEIICANVTRIGISPISLPKQTVPFFFPFFCSVVFVVVVFCFSGFLSRRRSIVRRMTMSILVHRHIFLWFCTKRLDNNHNHNNTLDGRSELCHVRVQLKVMTVKTNSALKRRPQVGLIHFPWYIRTAGALTLAESNGNANETEQRKRNRTHS